MADSTRELVARIVVEGENDFKNAMQKVDTEAKKTQQSFKDFEKVARPLGMALTGIGVAGLAAAHATKNWNNALGETLQKLQPLFVGLTVAGTALMVGVKAIKAFRVALVALQAQAISTTAALGVIGLIVGTVAAAMALMGRNNRDYTESIEGWDDALQSAQVRLRDLEDSGQGATAQAGELRREIEYLTDAIQEFSDLEKTNVVTETQLNEAWGKRSDLISEFTGLENDLTEATRKAENATKAGNWDTWVDNFQKTFFWMDSFDEQVEKNRASLADTSQDIQEITTNVINLLQSESFTLEELAAAYATADDELRVLIQSAMDFKAAALLDEATKEANKSLDDEINKLEELYGLRANASKSLIEQFEDETEARQDALNEQLRDVRDNTSDVIAQYRKEYNERVKLLDAETEAVVGALQDQLDALNDADEDSGDAREDAAFEDEKARIEKELAEAWTRKDKARLEEELANLLENRAEQLADREWQTQRESLQQQIQDVQDAASDKKAQWQEELDANIENQNAILEASEITIQSELAALESALITKRNILQQELNDAVAVQNAIRDNAIAAINAQISAQLNAANYTSVPLTAQGAIDMQSGMDYENWAASSGGGVRAYAAGGPILGPTLLYGLRSQKPYGIAGERGPEYISPSGGGDINITGTFYIREEADIAKVARELHRLRMRKGNMGS
jgi:hypothetical protein